MIWLYDCEVFVNDWIIVAHAIVTGERKLFHNDSYAVASWIDTEKPVLGGYNSKHYDQWILKAIYNGADNTTIKELNDFIIDGNNGWDFPWLSYKPAPWIGFDLMDDIPTRLRLKEIEGNLGMSIEESSIPFDLDRDLTDAELEEVVRYCHHDVDATVKLYKARSDYLQSKINVGALKGMDAAECMRLTNAKLTAEYLGAKAHDWGDETTYGFPQNLRIERYPETLKFFEKIDPTYKRELAMDIAGVPHTIAWGGLHGALKCYAEASTEKRKVLHIDVTSYYPSLMIVNGYLSRNAPDPEEFAQVYEKRLAAKKSGDKATANALKLVLNTTYGAMKNKYNNLYDPRMANAVCISGQLYLIDLIEKLEDIPSLKLIQSNTDGLIISCDIEHGFSVREVITEWEERTGFRMGLDEVERIIQKDVNNYVLRDIHGAIEVKGGYVTNYTGGDFINRSLVVVSEAVVECLLNNVPVERTIRECKDVWRFQMITKAGSSYREVLWGDYKTQNVNRVYASSSKEDKGLYKVKILEDGTERREKIANTPPHCLIDNENHATLDDIDFQFYIDLAKKRIDDYLGVKSEKPKKERKKKTMATKTTTTNSPKEALYSKLFQLQTTMDGYAWTKDGKNRHQSYEYITEKQYKTNFKKARAAAGLLWKMEETGHEYIGSISDKMHLILTQFRGRLIDPDTSEFEEYTFSGAGADNGDKALYKAYTGGLKFFLAANFLVAEDNDPENDEIEKPRYTSPAKREEVRETLSDQSAPATEAQTDAILEGVEMMREAKIADEIIDGILELVTDTMTREMAETIIEAIGEALEQ